MNKIIKVCIVSIMHIRNKKENLFKRKVRGQRYQQKAAKDFHTS